MAIRIRKVKASNIKGWEYVALCAANHKKKKGDLYLNDEMHDVLFDKLKEDLRSMGFIIGRLS